GRPTGRCVCGCPCAVAQDKANTDKATTNLQSWLVLPHAIFIPGDQFIEIGHDVIILWIDFCHHVCVIHSGRLRDRMMRGDSQADHDDCHGGRRNKSQQTEPASRPLERSCLLTNSPHHVPGKERRQPGLGNTTEHIPQFLVIFTIHILQLIELSAEMEVALKWQSYSQAGSFKEAFKLPYTSWMPHFAQCLCFDLPYTFAGDLKLPAYFLQGSAVAIDQ